MKIPVVTGNKKRYFDCYRQWLDKEQPNHHIYAERQGKKECLVVCI